MTSSEKNTTGDSPSSTSPPAPAKNPQPLTSPPLRVATTVPAPSSASPIPSPTNDPGSPLGFDPVDHAEPGNTRSSDEGGNVGRFDAKSIKDIARGLVLLGSRQVHDVLARTDQEQAEDVWVARSEDQKQIADPLASIAQRHGAIDAPPDIVNLIEAGLGLLAYVVYHAGKAWTIRRGLRKLRTVDPIREDNS